tara:strand:- start:568 stop:1056 length:489 start_codon:yes stop_codon:yes gene_type:complete
MNKQVKTRLMAMAIGLVYLWFGALKFVPNLSPAEDLAKNTIDQLTFGLIPDDVSIILLAIWEVGLGFLLIFGFLRRQAVILGLVHMVCTFAPLFFFPNDVFGEEPLSLTLVGQYIIKNLIIIAAFLSIYDKKEVVQKAHTPTTVQKQSSHWILAGKNLFKKA